MSDIVERLRKWSVFGYGYEASCDMKEAADEITALRAENEKLRAALKETASDFEMSLQIDKQKDAENERLRAALAKAADDLDDWGGYVAAQNARAVLEGK